MLLVSLALAAEAPADRLDRLIASKDLDRSALAGLARNAPTAAWQLLDPASRAALDLVLAMPPAEIRNVRQGQSALRDPDEWNEAETDAIDRLAGKLGTKRGKVQHVRVHTADNAVVLVELELAKSTLGIGIAWPADWATAGVAADLRAWLGVELRDAFLPLQDPSFENPLQLGFGWVANPRDAAALDPKRVVMGATSLRLQGPDSIVTQRLDLAPGTSWRLTGSAAADGADLTVKVVFEQGKRSESADAVIDTSGWSTFDLAVDVPPNTTGTRLELRAVGDGGVNVDNLVMRSATAQVKAAGWVTHTSGAIVVHADPMRGDGTPASEATRIDTAMRAGLGRISVATEGSVDVWLFADASQAAAARSLGAPTSADPDGGVCTVEPGDPWAAACPIRTMLTRAWGAPANELLGTGLPRALAGAGVDLDAGLRAQLGSVPSLASLTRVSGDRDTAAATSFAAWLLDAQSLAAARAAWQASDLSSYRAAKQDLRALEAAWRRKVSGG